MKEQQKVDEPLMSAEEFYKLNCKTDTNYSDMLNMYANYITQYHLQRQAEFIAEIAEIHYPASNNLNHTVNRESILSASKEYVELNIKR